MPPLPRLQFACPARWEDMDEADGGRFCRHCQHTVVNLSHLDEPARAALLARVGRERICGSFLVRPNGELVTPAAPLAPGESSRIRQFGIASLSAATLALAAGCVTPPPTSPTPPPAPPPAPTTGTPEAKPADDDAIVLLLGFIVCEPPHPPVTGFKK